MRVRGLESVNLRLGYFFSEVYKFLCHVSQIIFACGEFSGPGIRRPKLYILHLGEMGMVLDAQG
jgi:hypothetical protein